MSAERPENPTESGSEPQKGAEIPEVVLPAKIVEAQTVAPEHGEVDREAHAAEIKARLAEMKSKPEVMQVTGAPREGKVESGDLEWSARTAENREGIKRLILETQRGMPKYAAPEDPVGFGLHPDWSFEYAMDRRLEGEADRRRTTSIAVGGTAAAASLAGMLSPVFGGPALNGYAFEMVGSAFGQPVLALNQGVIGLATVGGVWLGMRTYHLARNAMRRAKAKKLGLKPTRI